MKSCSLEAESEAMSAAITYISVILLDRSVGFRCSRAAWQKSFVVHLPEPQSSCPTCPCSSEACELIGLDSWSSFQPRWDMSQR